jgi:hypothetical protein
MKKIATILIIALLVIAVPVQAFANKKACPEVTSLTDQGSNKYMSWNLETPQIHGLKSPKVEKSINKELAGTVKDFKKDILAQAKKAYKESKKPDYPFQPFEAQTVYKVHLLNKKMVSLTIDMYSYTGGAHGNTVRVAFNYNLKTGKQLGYQDIFKKCADYKDVIVQHITKEIEENPDNYFENAVETVKGFTDEQPFYITDKGIVVYYGLYEIAPYAAGIQEFFIPFSAFKC